MICRRTAPTLFVRQGGTWSSVCCGRPHGNGWLGLCWTRDWCGAITIPLGSMQRWGCGVAKSDRVLYVGTADGLYLVEEEDGEFEARCIGFQGMGVMRAPTVQDVD